MDATRRINRVSIGFAVVAVAVGVLTPLLAHEDLGVTLQVVDGRVEVASVNPYSQAAMGAMHAGMIVTELNGTELIRLPQPVYAPGYDPADPPIDPVTGEPIDQPPIAFDPPVPTPVVTDPGALAAVVAEPIGQAVAIDPQTFLASAATTFELGDIASVYGSRWNDLLQSSFWVVAGLALLFATAWWLGTGRAGATVAALAAPTALAVAAPFLLRPLEATWSPVGVGLYSVLMPAALLPLAASLALHVDLARDRWFAIAAAVASAGAAMAVGLARLAGPSGAAQAFPIAVLAGMSTFVPGIVAAGQRRAVNAPAAPQGAIPPATSGRLLDAAELAVIGATPFFAVTSAIGPFVYPLLLWLGTVTVASRLTVRPLARLANRAQLQRDLVVAATEAERARVAADIHDDALQELTLLVRRLDAAGDTEGADMARGISDRLRAICGDLRLPILDDLGVGPALDWLVLRIERLAGGEVRLERTDGTRPPADVELAFFRVAQEALANAVRHGSTPIVVRYRSTDAGVSMSVDDAGPGISKDAGERAERDGHYGLMNMHQRADGIGAILDVRRWPAGGTHVQLEWRQR